MIIGKAKVLIILLAAALVWIGWKVLPGTEVTSAAAVPAKARVDIDAGRAPLELTDSAGITGEPGLADQGYEKSPISKQPVHVDGLSTPGNHGSFYDAAAGPGDSPESSGPAIPPEAYDSGVPGLAPEAYDLGVPADAPEAGEVSSQNATPPEGDGGQ